MEDTKERNYAQELKKNQLQSKKEAAKKIVEDAVVKEVKRRVWLWVLGVTAAFLFNPITLSVIGGIIVIVIVMAIASDYIPFI